MIATKISTPSAAIANWKAMTSKAAQSFDIAPKHRPCRSQTRPDHQLRQLGHIRRDPARLIALRSLAGENRGKTNGQTDARPFGDIKNAML